MARLGCTVFSWDMVGYACSTQIEHKTASAFTLQTWNSIRALDYVLSLPGTDSGLTGVTGPTGRFTPHLEYPFIRRIYDFYGKGDLVGNEHYPREGHDYGFSKRQGVYKFSARHLSLDLQGFLTDDAMVDESPVLIEEEKRLKVFGRGNPRPAHAARGEDEILSELEKLR